MSVIKAFMPGPITIILNKSEVVPSIVTAGKDTIGVRMPQNEIARSLVELAGVPIATPSANLSGKPSGTEYCEIIKDFKNKIDYFIDSGKSKIGLASTIVRIEDNNVHILREGPISKEDIEEVIRLKDIKNGKEN